MAAAKAAEELLEEKKRLRKSYIKKRQAFTGKERAAADESIIGKILSLGEFKEAELIFLYASVRGEFPAERLLGEILKRGKKAAFPRVTADGLMSFYEVGSLEELSEGFMGIREPWGEALERKRERADMVVVPGCAFDRDFGRLGYGGGYYDRFLSDSSQTLALAPGYGLQLCREGLPKEKWDVRMDIIVTEEEIWKREKDNLIL